MGMGRHLPGLAAIEVYIHIKFTQSLLFLNYKRSLFSLSIEKL